LIINDFFVILHIAFTHGTIMKIRYYALIITLVLWLAPISVRGEGMRFSNYTIPSTSNIFAIDQDEQGMIWVGTNRGLYSFDGYSGYSHSQNQFLSDCAIQCMMYFNHRLFLGTREGLFIYNIWKNEYEKVNNTPKDIRALLQVNGQIYIGAQTGLYTYSNKIIRKESNISLGIYSLVKYDDQLLAGTLQGLFSIKGHRVRRIFLPQKKQTLVNALLYDYRHHSVWVGTEGALYAYRQGKITEEKALRGNSVKTLAQKANGVLFIGTDNGLYTLSDNHSVARYVHDSRFPSTLINNIIWTIFCDRWDNLWLGTDNGFSLLAGKSAMQWVSLSDITKSGEGNILHVFYQDNDGTNWTGGTDGILRFNMTGSNYTDVVWYRFGDKNYPLSHNRVRKIYKDSDGSLWLATDHGINFYNPETRQFRNFIITDRSGVYSTTWAYDIAMDKQHRLWITSYMGGIFVISKRRLLASNGHCVADYHLSMLNGLPNIRMRELVIDAKGNVWALVNEKGLVCLPRGQKRVKTYNLSKMYRAIATDSKGRLWVGYDGGIDIFSSPSSAPLTISFSDNNVYRRVRAICAVKQSMWIFTESECLIYDMNGKITNFRLPASNINAAVYSAKDDNVYLAGNDGFYRVDVTQIIQLLRQHRKTTMTLAALFVNGKLYDKAGQNVSSCKEIELKYKENDLAFCLTDFPYNNFPSALYAYKLEGLDKGWTTLDNTSGRITYSGLSYGRYRLVVKTLDGAGHPDGEIYSLRLRILPPWYLTIWARMIYLLLFMLLCFWLFNFWRVRQCLRETQKEKEKILEQVQLKTSFYARLAQKFNQHLSLLMTTANHMLSPSMKEEPEKMKSQQEWDVMRKESAEMITLVHRELVVETEQRMQENADPTSVDTIEYLRLLVGDYKEKAKTKKLSLSFITNTGVLFEDVDIISWHNLFTSLMDYLIDESQSQAAVTVSVETNMVDEQVSFMLQSNRITLSTEQRAMMFQSLSPIYKVKDYVQQNGGRLDVEIGSDILTFHLIFAINRYTAKPIEVKPKEVIRDSSDEKLLAEVTEVIEKNIVDSDFNVTRLQETLGIGNKQLYRKIKTLTGMTPVEFIRSIRLRRAAALLKEEKFSVSEVMYMVGFSDSSYFAKCFQKAFGVNPKQYK
jgi:ligand-binding sensor domain-containing protein/AraC-like DNA-binding protein